MRCYTFGNYYMSSIQQGIQAAHVVAELFVKYKEQCTIAVDLYDWAEKHKTLVCLNGGNLQGLRDIKELFEENRQYVWTCFFEDDESLGGILTNVCIILPEHIYNTAAKIRTREFSLSYNDVYDEYNKFILKLSEFDVKLITLLNSCQLAR